MALACTDANRFASATRLVLYVEDNAADAKLVGEALSEVGCRARLEVVENAVQAFEFLANRGRFADIGVPDLILLDLQLPIIGGHQALGVIRSHDRWKRIPVQVITSSAHESDRHISESLGARFATKPRTWREYLSWAANVRDLLHPPSIG